uniref:Receptor ligand binding region domain-containing protein n=1 Tax=Timema douglasi TaxID=61478 RepID=A0A7R8VNC0_TIMDO|nr:unnamed protein product [Timema douglasi]
MVTIYTFSYPSCSGRRAPGLAADMHFNDKVIAFIGPACAFALEPVARLAAYWNRPIITGMGDQSSDHCASVVRILPLPPTTDLRCYSSFHFLDTERAGEGILPSGDDPPHPIPPPPPVVIINFKVEKNKKKKGGEQRSGGGNGDTENYRKYQETSTTGNYSGQNQSFFIVGVATITSGVLSPASLQSALYFPRRRVSLGVSSGVPHSAGGPSYFLQSGGSDIATNVIIVEYFLLSVQDVRSSDYSGASSDGAGVLEEESGQLCLVACCRDRACCCGGEYRVSSWVNSSRCPSNGGIFKDKTEYATLTRMSYCQCRLKLVFSSIFNQFGWRHVALLLDRSDLFSLTVGEL